MTSTASPRYRADELADKIRHRLIDDKWAEGDFFMTHAQLAQEYGVSLSTTREAVSRLQELGVLEGRKRKGLIVRRSSPVELLSRSIPAMANSEKDIHELARLRYVLEVGAIELAVINATDVQVEQLEQLAKEFEQAVNDGVGLVRENDLELAFHGVILQMTHSPLIAGMQQVLATFFSRDPVEADQQTVWQHHAIAAAIRGRDIERARVMIRLHFEGDQNIVRRSPPDGQMGMNQSRSAK
jgi:DNA-binding FadR family transcriptional regulator